MSQSAKIILIGEESGSVSRAALLERIHAIKSWDGGHNYPIEVQAGHDTIMDSISNVEGAINGDLQKYIVDNFYIPKSNSSCNDNFDLGSNECSKPVRLYSEKEEAQHSARHGIRRGPKFTKPKRKRK